MISSMTVFGIGGVSFAVMLLIKLPVKKLTRKVAKDFLQYRHLNVILIVLTFLMALLCYCFVLAWLGESHFKLCCVLKATAVAMAIYAVYEQWFGEDSMKSENK